MSLPHSAFVSASASASASACVSVPVSVSTASVLQSGCCEGGGPRPQLGCSSSSLSPSCVELPMRMQGVRDPELAAVPAEVNEGMKMQWQDPDPELAANAAMQRWRR
eukprot:1149426-Rhodomonas_salina.2